MPPAPDEGVLADDSSDALLGLASNELALGTGATSQQLSSPDPHLRQSSSYGAVRHSSAKLSNPNSLSDSRLSSSRVLTRPRRSFKERFSHARSNFNQIYTTPRELWVIFLLKFFSSYSYFSVSLILTLLLTNEYGLSDIDAGWAYGAYGVSATLYGAIFSWLIDYLGVRGSLILGAVCGTGARLALAVSTSRFTAVAILLSILPFSESLGIPIMTIAVKRYTNDHTRTFAFSLFYSVMNVAALFAGPLVDVSRSVFRNGFELNLGTLGIFELSALKVVVLSSAVSTAAMLVISIFFVREIEVDRDGNINSFQLAQENIFSQSFKTLRERKFWRFALLTLLLLGARLVFRHNDATLPKYLTRQFGEDAPYGVMYAINPFLIIIFVPLVGLFLEHVPSFPMIHIGSFLSGLSPFWICLHESYLTVVLYLFTLSVGEAIYSPRVYEYSMQLSGRGSEGLYSSLAAAPLFTVKLLVGGMSGWLLKTYMPADGPHNGKVMWAIIGASCVSSPILLCFVRDFIRDGDEDAYRKLDTPRSEEER